MHDSVPGTATYGCQLCHLTEPTEFEPPDYDSFGEQSKQFVVTGEDGTQVIDWSGLCPLDADGDGYSNGREVDDPDCNYPEFIPDSTSSDPGDTNSVPFDEQPSDAGMDASEDGSSDASDDGEAQDTEFHDSETGNDDGTSNSGSGCSVLVDEPRGPLEMLLAVLLLFGLVRISRLVDER
jgi:hypothetical protein